MPRQPVRPHSDSVDPPGPFGPVRREVAALRAGVAFAPPAQPKPPAVPRGSSAPCPPPWWGGAGPWGSGVGTEDVVPMASVKVEMGSAWVIRTEEITPSLPVPDSFQCPEPSPLSNQAFHLLPTDPSPRRGGTAVPPGPCPCRARACSSRSFCTAGRHRVPVQAALHLHGRRGEDGLPGPRSPCSVFLRGLYPAADGFSHSPRALPRRLSPSPRAGCNEKCTWLPILEWEVKAKKPEASAPRRVGCG